MQSVFCTYGFTFPFPIFAILKLYEVAPINDPIVFPENLADFFHWVKETTEAYWRNMSSEEMIHGAKWLPLTDTQIDELELRYSIQFDEEHRLFLKILHTIDKHYYADERYGNPEFAEDYVETEEDKAIREFWHPLYRPSLFYNWITEKEWIESRLMWVEHMYRADILGANKLWLKSWGVRPESDEEKILVFEDWYRKAPRLLPVTAHTFLMADGGYGLRPLMSVYGFDTIIVAWSLRHFLLSEFGTELGLTEKEYDEDCPEGYDVLVKGIPELDTLQTIRLDDAIIPCWKEALTYFHHPGREYWQGFWVPWSTSE
jgi:hypothetical protein